MSWSYFVQSYSSELELVYHSLLVSIERLEKLGLDLAFVMACYRIFLCALLFPSVKFAVFLPDSYDSRQLFIQLSNKARPAKDLKGFMIKIRDGISVKLIYRH